MAGVRNAKANELNAQAELLKAQAGAETTLANAQAELLKAKAELEKANAKKVQAEAEYQQVLTDLKGVEVQLQKVKVEEEKVRLQYLQEELKVKLVELEAAKKEAEAELQYWMNQLEALKAAAQVQAINAQKQLMEAQKAMEELMLTYEADKANEMRAYVETYFGVCQALIELQKQAIDMEVEINAYIDGYNGRYALAVEEYNRLSKEYGELEATIAAVKQYQTMTPEEKEAKMEESYAALNEAITAWGEATDAYNAAWEAYDDYTANNASMYVEGWDLAFAGYMEALHPVVTEYIETEGYTEPIAVEGYWKVDEDGEPTEFVPLWQGEQWVNEPYYFLVDPKTGMYNPTYGFIDEVDRLSPAAVHSENLNKTLDEDVEEFKAAAELAKEVVDEMAVLQKDQLEQEIAEIDEVLDKEKEYLSTRKPVVEAAEKAFVDALAAYNEAREGNIEAWDAYTEYMIMTYDIKRTYFQNVYDAKANKEAKDIVVTKAKAELDAAKELVPTAEDIYNAELAAAEKEAAYNKAVKTYNDGKTADAVKTAAEKYDGKGNGSDEKAAVKAKEDADKALEAWRAANVAATADPDNAEKKQALEDAKKALDDANKALTDANQALATSKKAYEDASAADLKAQEPVTAAEKAWNDAKEALQEKKDYVVDPLLEEAFIMADADTAIANASLKKCEEQLAAAFEVLDQEGVKYEEDPKFAELYKAYLESDDELDALGPWTYWDPEKSDYVYGAAGEAYNALYKLYYTVYRNKDGYQNPYRYMRCAYDLDSKALFISAWDYDYDKQAYVAIWFPMGGYRWDPVYDEDGNIIDYVQIFDEDGNPVIDETYSRAYQKAQLEEQIEGIPAEVEAAKTAIDEGVTAFVEYIDGIRANIAVYDGWKAGYDTYATEVQALSDAINEAEKTSNQVYYEFVQAKAAYKALEGSLQEYFYIYEEDWEAYEDLWGPYVYAYNVDLYIEWCEEELAEIAADIQEVIDNDNADYEATLIWLQKKEMEYELLLKKIAVYEEIAAKYQALVEELFGINLSAE